MKNYFTKTTWHLMQYSMLVLFALCLLSNASKVQAQCANVVYQTTYATASNTAATTFSSLNLNTGVRTIIASPLNNVFALNGLGYYAATNMIWGYSADGLTVINPANGITGVFGPVAGVSGFGITAIIGEVLPNGYYIFVKFSTVYTVDINPARTSTYLKLVDATNGFALDTAPFGFPITTASVAGQDWAYNPIDGLLYSVDATSLSKYNPLTNTATTISLTGMNAESASVSGGIWKDSNPNVIYVYFNTSGNTYSVDLTTNIGTLLPDNNAFPATYTDGASCTTATLVPCSAGNTAPTVSAASICLSPTTANLTTLQSGTPPAGTTFKWHTGTPGTSANAVVDPTAVGAGTYYLSYYNATGGCYSPTSVAVTVNPALGISAQPSSTTICPGASTSFTGAASGTGPFT